MQVTAHRHAEFNGSNVTIPREGEECIEGGLQVALVGDPTFERADLIGALDAVADVECQRRVAAGVPQRHRAGLSRGDETLSGVLADRLQHPEPVARAIQLHERLVDE